MSDRMRRKGNMPRHVKNQWGWWWQLSKRGAAKRARFCLKMADQCKSEKEAKKRV